VNPVVFLLGVWLFLGFDRGLRDMLQLGSFDVAPSFLMVFLAFVALWASSRTALAGAIGVGLALDVLRLVPLDSGDAVSVIGPHALGLAAGTYTILVLRPLMYRRNVLTIAFSAFVLAAMAGVVATGLLAIRTIIDERIILSGATSDLFQRVLSGLYTGVVAIPLGWLLERVRPVFGFRKPGVHFLQGGSARR